MNINFNSISQSALSFFSESELLSLTDQQKQILLIASTAFLTFTAAYGIKRYFTSRPKQVLMQGQLINWEQFSQIYDGKLEGPGKITYLNGIVCEGEFKNGMLNGKGKRTFKSGAIHEGEFKNGMLHGPGKKISAYGQVMAEGIFDQDSLIDIKMILL